MTKAVWSAAARLAVVVALGFGSTSCGKVVRQGEGTSYLIIRALEGASGAEPGEFGTTLSSDVLTVVDDSPTIFGDSGRVTFGLGLKDPGPPTSPVSPSPLEHITVDRYRVTFIRSDGRNTPGVDVPYSFDGAITVTVGGDTEAGFTLVRNQAKSEPPLSSLRCTPGVFPNSCNSVIISTIAEITFFGRDQTGRAASVTGRISVDFGDFGDPD
jgi:hypothetical protein